MVTTLAAPTTCRYTPFANGIHEFVFTVPSRQALAGWFDYLDTIYHATPTGATIPLLIDLRQSGLLPMTHISDNVRDWLQAHPSRHSAHIAVLHSHSFPVALAQTFLRRYHTRTDPAVRFFSERERDEAVMWLTERDYA
jgi:hypothetical protein